MHIFIYADYLHYSGAGWELVSLKTLDKSQNDCLAQAGLKKKCNSGGRLICESSFKLITVLKIFTWETRMKCGVHPFHKAGYPHFVSMQHFLS